MIQHHRRAFGFGMSLLLMAGFSFAFGTLHPDAVPQAHAKKHKDSKILPVGKSPFKGPSKALITIIEFSDFQCPFCSRANKTLEKLAKKHPDVRIVFKHQPLPFHKQAKPAARASLAAHKQGKFWEMHDLLFENSRNLKSGNIDTQLEGYAKQLGLNVKKFRKDYNSSKIAKLVQKDMDLAKKVGARGTPTFFINGVKLVGAQPLAKFEALINAERRYISSARFKRDTFYATRVKGQFAPPGVSSKPNAAPKPPPDMIYNVAIQPQDAMRGNLKNPLVTIVEFSDYQCPFCARAEGTVEQVMKTYSKDVRLVYKHLPLSFHKQAETASRAALAAGKQGKYWEYHALLYQQQREMRDPEFFIGIANKVGLDVSRFERDMNDPKLAKQVQDDIAQAATVDAKGTPNFFINGIKISGAQPYAKFEEIIDAQLKIASKVRSKNRRLGAEPLYQKIIKANRKGKGKAMKAYEMQLAIYKAQQKKEEADRLRKAKEEAATISKSLKIGNAPVLGSRTAPVIIYEFTDLQCPFCSRAHKTLQQLVQAYPGKVAIVSKQFPLSFHKEAEPAARAALAAGNQGKFWEMRDLLFKRQKDMRSNPRLFIELADQLGLDLNKFERDMKDPAIAQHVKDDMAVGSKIGVRGTPHFFINGVRMSGAQPLAKFKEAVDDALKNKK